MFNRGTRGQSSGTCRQESAWTNEKTIWGELAYWHQAWRQREAVRGNSPNDRSLRTAAHYYNSCPFSVMYCIPSPTWLFTVSLFCPSSLLHTRVFHHSSLSLYYVGCVVPKENLWFFSFIKNRFYFILQPYLHHSSAPITHHSSFSLIITRWFTDPGSNLIHPRGWSVLSLLCRQSKVIWRSSYHHHQSANFLYWPNYYSLLAIITLNYQFKIGQWFTFSGLLPIVSPLWLPRFFTFSKEFGQRSSVAKKTSAVCQRLSAL